MTNPNNAVGTPAAFSGRSSVKGFNDLTQAFTRGIISGWEIAPKSGMTINVGGTADVRDSAVAEDAAGNRTTIDNRLGTPIAVTIATAPSANSRIDAIVAYVQPNPTGDGTTQDNPAVCGIIAAQGTTAASPVAPSDAQIRTAITNDGGTGGSAYYAILGTVTVGANVTTIGSGVIAQGTKAEIAPQNPRAVTTVSGSTTSTSYANNGNGFTAAKDGLYFMSIIAGTNISATDFIYSLKITKTGESDIILGANSTTNYAGNKSASLVFSQMYWMKTGDKIQPQTKTDNASVAASTTMRVTRVI
jgi:hypothetical protein